MTNKHKVRVKKRSACQSRPTNPQLRQPEPLLAWLALLERDIGSSIVVSLLINRGQVEMLNIVPQRRYALTEQDFVDDTVSPYQPISRRQRLVRLPGYIG